MLPMLKRASMRPADPREPTWIAKAGRPTSAAPTTNPPSTAETSTMRIPTLASAPPRERARSPPRDSRESGEAANSRVPTRATKAHSASDADGEMSTATAPTNNGPSV